MDVQITQWTQSSSPVHHIKQSWSNVWFCTSKGHVTCPSKPTTSALSGYMWSTFVKPPSNIFLMMFTTRSMMISWASFSLLSRSWRRIRSLMPSSLVMALLNWRAAAWLDGFHFIITAYLNEEDIMLLLWSYDCVCYQTRQCMWWICVDLFSIEH